MKKQDFTLVFYLCLALGICPVPATRAQVNQPVSNDSVTVRSEIRFDDGWRFHRGGAQGAHESTFDDSTWRAIDLPHDWSIEDLPGTDSPFSRDAITQAPGGFTTGGTGWYRNTFYFPEDQKDRRVLIQFDGVYMNSDVWLNGVRLGNHPYGYTPFWYDVTEKIHFGATNVLAVKVQNEGENSRWYSGSGIYRHVWLKVLEPVHVDQNGIYITTPEVTAASANVKIQTRLINQGGDPVRAGLVTYVIDGKGVEVTRTRADQDIKAGEVFEFHQEAEIKSPATWSPEHPTLYTNITEVYLGDKLADRLETRFGIRSLTYDTTHGFRLNGEVVKMKGGCFHNDNGPVGSRAYDRAEERKVELLKASGYNTIRCSHNPPSPAFLDACDRLGMLVMDEAFDTWETGKNPADYHLYFKDWWQKDITTMVERDRNHPSIVMWSIGNEIPEKQKPAVAATAKMLADLVRKLDPTRPVTSAVENISEDKDAFFAAQDVAGYNYPLRDGKNMYELDHQRLPGRIMVCTESYPLEAFESWMEVVDRPYVIGDFVWTAWDYLGEASIGWRGYFQYQNFYPWNLAFCGDIDICGWKRAQSYYRDALWMTNQLSIFVQPPEPSFEVNPKREEWSKWHFFDVVPDWNWPGRENHPLTVNVYSSCEEVDLLLNGKSLGRKPTGRSTRFMATWEVGYQPGRLQAVGYSGGKQVNTAELRSAAAPAQIKLQADRTKLRADGEDLSYVIVELTDAKGVRDPKAENLIKFDIDGPATIVGIGNANPMSIESYQQSQRKAWQGRCLVILKSGHQPGPVILRAAAEGITPGQISLNIGH